MKVSKASIAVALVAAIAGAMPVSAQRRHSGESRGTAVPRGSGENRVGPRGGGGAQPEGRVAGGEVQRNAGRSDYRRSQPNGYASSRSSYSGSSYRRTYAAPARAGTYYRPAYRPAYYGPAAYRPAYYRPVYRPVRYYRPYYAFRPHISIGFGLWAGYPVAYSASFYYGYAHPYPYPPAPYAYPAPAYPYPPSAYPNYPAYPPAAYPPSYPPSAYPPSNAPAPGYPGSTPGAPGSQSNLGGLSFEITPSTAEIVVDGQFVGTVDQFTPLTQPLGLSAGRHRIELRAEGYRTLTFDVQIAAGQVLPYRGTLER